MTKKVRIENADTSDYLVTVTTVQKGPETPDGPTPDVIVSEQDLPYPTAMGDFYIHSGQYLVIKEKTK